MSISRVFERPDGSLAIVSPAPASRGVVEHPFEQAIRVPASLTTEQHNAAIAAAATEILLDHPDLEDADRRLEVTAALVEINEDGQNILEILVRVVFLTPEPDADWLARVFARTVEASIVRDADGKVVDSGLDGLPFVDVDPDTLPSKTAPCTDGCGEEHPVRNTWRMQGAGQSRTLAADLRVRNVHAEIRHLDLAAEDELAKPSPDGGRLATIDVASRRLIEHQQKGTAPPPADVVANLTRASLAARSRRGSGQARS